LTTPSSLHERRVVKLARVRFDRREHLVGEHAAGTAPGPPRYQAGMRSFSWSCSDVAISPGYTVVSDTPVPLSSWRSASANMRCAAFVAP
jgi:hypothetical protein